MTTDSTRRSARPFLLMSLISMTLIGAILSTLHGLHDDLQSLLGAMATGPGLDQFQRFRLAVNAADQLFGNSPSRR